ncbi:MAG: hypothetical protein J0L82_09075 [Deltaproteobacteria bacterium]|jgi:hypothetical protein|nr:hypothetical protein [Deltaproteobacteria bacterium]
MNAKFLIKAVSLIIENPQWRRKLKTMAIVGIIGLVLSGGLVIWAGWSAAKYLVKGIEPTVATSMKAVESAETAISHGKVPALGLITSAEKCWTTVQGIVESENLLGGSLAGGLQGALISMKNACLAAMKSKLPINTEETTEKSSEAGGEII